MDNPLERATPEDYVRSVEVDGTVTDPYRAIAAQLYNCKYEKVTSHQRNVAKKTATRQGFL